MLRRSRLTSEMDQRKEILLGWLQMTEDFGMGKMGMKNLFSGTYQNSNIAEMASFVFHWFSKLKSMTNIRTMIRTSAINTKKFSLFFAPWFQRLQQMLDVSLSPTWNVLPGLLWIWASSTLILCKVSYSEKPNHSFSSSSFTTFFCYGFLCLLMLPEG